MYRIFRVAALLAVALFASGCASVLGSTSQSVTVQTLEKSGNDLSGANCEMNNDEGKWFVTTPGSVVVHRSNKDLQVLCQKDGYDAGTANVVSSVKGSMFGNILLGGGVGAIVDHANGSAYEYPQNFQIMMGSNITIQNKPAVDTTEKADDPTRGGYGGH